MSLYIDLTKGQLNRAKLVQRRTMVRGQNGKIYYRMQWVDPKTGQPVSNNRPSEVEQQPNTHQMTQKEFIDKHVKNLPRSEKYKELERHGIEWEHHEHPKRDHMNAVMALKEHYYKHPHLVGAEHLPKEDDGLRPDGIDGINSFLDDYKNHPDLLYDMMRHYGIIGADEPDPRTVEGQQSKKNGGNGMGAIKHMRNAMALKKFFKTNPGKLDEAGALFNIDANVSGNEPIGETPPKISKPAPPKPESAKTIAEKGGNTIKGVLDSMPREQKYNLCKKLGIADGDPLLDPTVSDKMKPIKHLRNMMELRKAIEKDPHVLFENPDGELTREEKERISNLEGKEKLKQEVKDFMYGASKKLKEKWAEEYADHDEMKNRKTNKDANIDYMHKMEALNKILMKDPSIMDKLKPEAEKEQLLNMKIGNKNMQKVLAHLVGLSGVGDIMNGFDKGRSWEFWIDSTAEITKDRKGNPILSVVETGKDGDHFNEIEIPMQKVKDFLDKVSNGEIIDSRGRKPKDTTPLHEKDLSTILETLSGDEFGRNFTPEVQDIIKKEFSKMWIASGKSSSMKDILSKSTNSKFSQKILRRAMRHWKVPLTGANENMRIKTNTDNFKRIVYGHLVEKTKTKNVMDYLQTDSMGRKTDTWVLHESAKQWTPDERAEARKEFLHNNTHIDDLDKYDNGEDRSVKFNSHLHKSLEMVPFDLLTDVLANGTKFKVSKLDAEGKPLHRNAFRSDENTIYLDHGYVDDEQSLMSSDHPLFHIPKPRQIDPNDPIRRYNFFPLSDTAAHEFAHAIDNYLSGGQGQHYKWDKTEQGRKYAGKNARVVPISYNETVGKTNKGRVILQGGTKSDPYLFHADSWISSYEGRIYDKRYYDDPKSMMKPDKTGAMVDEGWTDKTVDKGIEHWSENVSRVFNAVHAYQMWKQSTGNTHANIDDWSSKMHSEYKRMGFGDDSTKLGSYNRDFYRAMKRYPQQAYGYMYKAVQEKYPRLFDGIRDILLRSDFLDSDEPGDVISRSEQGDYTRKSLELTIQI